MRRHNMVYREPQAFASHPAGLGLRLSLISERHLTWQMCTEFKVHCTKDIQPQYSSYSKYKFLRNSYNITDNITNYSIVEFCKPFMLKFGFQFFSVSWSESIPKYPTIYPVQSHRGAEAYPSCHRTKSSLHLIQFTSLLQAQHREINNCSY